MSDSTTLEQFIAAHLGNVDQLRAMLLLCSESPNALGPIEVASKLYIPMSLAAEILARFEANGLAASTDDPKRYRCHPRTPEIDVLMKQVIQLDREMPVTLLNIIYARPTGIQAFVEAFKLRKERNE